MGRSHRFTVVPGVSNPRPIWSAWLGISLGTLCALCSARSALAANGTWTNTTSGGLWSTTTNWSGGTVANGSGGIADFSTLNITADDTVHLDTARTIGQLLFGDTTPSNNWILDNNGNAANFLSFLFSSSPQITVNNQTATLNLGIGQATVTKSGAGKLVLGGSTDNTALGMVVNAGTLVLAKSSSHAPDIHAIGGGGLTIGGGTVQLGGTGGDQIFDQAGVTINSGTFDFNGQSETFDLLSGSGGTITNNLDGTTSTMTFGAFNSGGTYSGVIQNGGDLFGIGFMAVTKTGSGVEIFSGANTYNRATTINQGTLQGGAANTFSAGSAVNVAGGATLNLGGFSQSIGSLTGAGNVTTTGTTGADTLTVGSDGTSPAAFSGVVSDASGGRTLALTKVGDGTITLSGNNTFTGSVTVNAGTLTLSGSNAFTGGATVNGGTLTLSGNNTFTGGVTINAGAMLQLGNAGALNSAAPNAVTNNGTLNLNGNSITLLGLTGSGTFQNASSTAATLTVNVSGALNDSFAGGLQDGLVNGFGGAPLSLAKTGPGTLTIGSPLSSGNVTYTGTTTISGGTLRVETFGTNPQSNGTATAFTSTAIVDNGVLEFDIGFIPPLLGKILPVYLGSISGSGSLTKSGGGTLILAGDDTYAGTTTISGGTLELLVGSLAGNVVNQANFVYDGGTFSGRLTNFGTAQFDSDFIPGNGMENDGIATAAAGVNLTFNEAGLDNEGTLTAPGGTITLIGAANINRGNLNPTSLILTGATLANNGSLVLAGGSISGASGMLTNGPGGVISGTGTISTGFINAGGVLALSSGTMNISQPFNNSGMIELDGIAANLAGGAITNSGTIQGFGNIANAIFNTPSGTIEALGGTLSVGGTLTNPAGGLLTAGTGTKLVVTAGLAANAGVINLTGGTFDNNGFALNNTGQISGWGIFRVGGTGLDNNGSITFSGSVTTVNGPVTNENGKTITVAQNNAIFTGLVTNNASATFNAINATATFAGGFVNNGNSNFVKAGGGIVEIDSAPTLSSRSTLSLTTGTLRFNLVSGAPTIGTGVTAVVSSGATLELAGSVSALANGANRVNIINNSNAPGILVSGTNQQVGNIAGLGGTQVIASSDLTANHIIQSALAIGGTAVSHGLVTIDASDASGNPLDQLSRLALAGLLTPNGPFAAGETSSVNLGSVGGGDDLLALSLDNPAGGGNPSPTPEPSTFLLTLLAALGAATIRFAPHHSRRQLG